MLSLRNDPKSPGHGFALLEGPELEGVSAVSIENCFSGLFLGLDGRWAKTQVPLPVASIDGALSLGPHIVDFIPTDSQVAFRDSTGRKLGQVFWEDILPSRNPGSVKPRDVPVTVVAVSALVAEPTKPADTVEPIDAPQPEPVAPPAPDPDLVVEPPPTPQPEPAPVPKPEPVVPPPDPQLDEFAPSESKPRLRVADVWRTAARIVRLRLPTFLALCVPSSIMLFALMDGAFQQALIPTALTTSVCYVATVVCAARVMPSGAPRPVSFWKQSPTLLPFLLLVAAIILMPAAILRGSLRYRHGVETPLISSMILLVLAPLIAWVSTISTIEGVGIFGATRRAGQLAKGRGWYVSSALFQLLIVVIAGVVLVWSSLGLLHGPMHLDGWLVTGAAFFIGTSLFPAVAAMVSGIFSVALYSELRRLGADEHAALPSSGPS